MPCLASGLRRSTGLLAAAVILTAVFFLASCSAPASRIKTYSNHDILIKMGDGFYFNERYEESIEQYSQAIELRPDLAIAAAR